MNPSLAKMLTRLYPRAWRERYGAEFEVLLSTGRGGLRGDLRTVANVFWSALQERVSPTPGPGRGRSQFHSWCLQAPWAMFGLAPLFLLAGAYFVACCYLWSGWQILLPGADTPFGGRPVGPVYGFENIYFQAGKFYYFGAPLLVGWAIGIIAIRQRVKTLWPTIGLVLTAWMGGTARIEASRTTVHSGLGHISMHFAPGSSAQDIYGSLFHSLVILSLTVLPYLVWQLASRHRADWMGSNAFFRND
jgi:hypothetical protein